jgi:hypothetical protein
MKLSEIIVDQDASKFTANCENADIDYSNQDKYLTKPLSGRRFEYESAG